MGDGLNDNNAILNSVDVVVEVGVELDKMPDDYDKGGARKEKSLVLLYKTPIKDKYKQGGILAGKVARILPENFEHQRSFKYDQKSRTFVKKL